MIATGGCWPMFYRPDGRGLSAFLLAQGLALQVVVPPNTDGWHCLRSVESEAKRRGVGLWGEGAYRTLKSNELSAKTTGFQQVSGVVSSVQRSRHNWWISLDKLAVRLNDKDLHYFGVIDPPQWLGRFFANTRLDN